MNPRILSIIHFRPSGHNQVFLDHLECITDFLEEFCPIEKSKAKRMLRGSMGISMRYVQEHLDSLEAWKIIKYKSGNIEYLLERPGHIILEEVKFEDVPDTFPGNTGMIPDCSRRPKDKYEQCNPSEGVYISSKKMLSYCGTCKSRSYNKEITI